MYSTTSNPCRRFRLNFDSWLYHYVYLDGCRMPISLEYMQLPDIDKDLRGAKPVLFSSLRRVWVAFSFV
jgi:hypothetical protein